MPESAVALGLLPETVKSSSWGTARDTGRLGQPCDPKVRSGEVVIGGGRETSWSIGTTVYGPVPISLEE